MANTPQTGNFMFYRAEDGLQSVRVFVQDETIWLSQREISDIFGVSVKTVNEHLINIFSTQELDRNSTIRKFRIVQSEGNREVSRDIDFYSLDAIIAVGYRVNSYKATRFRQWATIVLREYLIKGFAMDDERLKQGKTLFGKDYFDELLARIAEIRASEARFYEKVRHLFALSYDYDGNDQNTYKFFANAQNKLEYAVTGHTAAELIQLRADSNKKNMGLSSWKGQKRGERIIQTDVTVAKNYLHEDEISELNRLVSMFLDYASNLVRQKKKIDEPLLMEGWENKINGFLDFNGFKVLRGYGSRKKLTADKHAKVHFSAFRKVQDKQFLEAERALQAIKLEGKMPEVEHASPPVHEFDKKLKKALDFKANDVRPVKKVPFARTLWKYALIVMYKSKSEFVTTSDLQEGIPTLVEIPEGLKKTLSGRNDTKLTQHIRNLKSHRSQKTSFIYKGYATVSDDGFQITKKGREFIDSEMSEYL